jgi:hypothetical protein
MKWIKIINSKSCSWTKDKKIKSWILTLRIFLNLIWKASMRLQGNNWIKLKSISISQMPVKMRLNNIFTKIMVNNIFLSRKNKALMLQVINIINSKDINPIYKDKISYSKVCQAQIYYLINSLMKIFNFTKTLDHLHCINLMIAHIFNSKILKTKSVVYKAIVWNTE